MTRINAFVLINVLDLQCWSQSCDTKTLNIVFSHFFYKGTIVNNELFLASAQRRSGSSPA